MVSADAEYSSSKGIEFGPGLECQLSDTAMLNMKYKILSSTLVAAVSNANEKYTLTLETALNPTEQSLVPSVNIPLGRGFSGLINAEYSNLGRMSFALGYSYKISEKTSVSVSPRIGLEERFFYGVDLSYFAH